MPIENSNPFVNMTENLTQIAGGLMYRLTMNDFSFTVVVPLDVFLMGGLPALYTYIDERLEDYLAEFRKVKEGKERTTNNFSTMKFKD